MYPCALCLFTTGGPVPAFRIQVSETHNKEFIVACADRQAAELAAADILSVATRHDETHTTKEVLVIADQKESLCAIAEVPDEQYQQAAHNALRRATL